MKSTLMRPGGLPASSSTPVVTPLMPSVVYASDTPDALDAQYAGQAPGYTYAREGHPNADVLARRIDALEGAEDGWIVGSGMAAVAAVLLGLTKAGDHVVGGDQLYGRSLRLMAEDLPRLGISTSLADVTDLASVEAALRPETRLVLIEVVSNPTLRIADLDGIAALCKARGVLLVVDNTFTTPRGVRPFDRGADVVLHSVTKLLAGHSDVTLGWVAAKDPALMEKMRIFAVTTGLTPSPFDCWLAERGLASFELRHERAQDTARRLADLLAGQAGIKRVIYPTRDDHPDRARAQSVLRGRGGNMMSFELDGGRAEANAFAAACAGVAFAPTLGDVGTTLSHPASSSHRALSAQAREAVGISEGFFRVSVGLEDPEALMASFDAGLAAVRAGAQ
ncbi:aminotransferase class I/II-fold pyridoxal phosphate-dependent enzyme [Mesobacterium sp. TK19101]|uniref:Aminotransferase class I/II-fold pyridoxal phosphate-dependent enzyme n=1 Tax=Mesobacterium hydrothermale TaxID=3111907 RepID=A0ABU6HJ43_9RHOB|nr:aminotransferase class I/II-fold pyridoxal phosphate-dependent enzyme [Mesobacterium sp. TK19101]MEC3862402.1 aminotransferase class I/II-fold pyridoxal phosphate-dependent enzyme [Mesobacterium sp. TK19101]